MAQVTYRGPHDAVEVPSLADLGEFGVFVNGVAREIPDDRLGTLPDNPDYKVESAAPAKAAPEPAPAPAESAPTEGN